MQNKELFKKFNGKYSIENIEIDIDKLHPNPWNPNKENQKTFDLIKKSIDKHGLINYPLVRSNPEYYNEGEYEIIAGEHRWKACKELGYESIKVDCIKEEMTMDDAKELTLLLNLRGENDAIEEARMLKEMLSKQGVLIPFDEKEVKNKMELLDFDFSIYEKDEEVEQKQRSKNLIIALTQKEENIVRHAFSLTKRNKDLDAFMVIVEEYLATRGGLKETLKVDEDGNEYENTFE